MDARRSLVYLPTWWTVAALCILTLIFAIAIVPDEAFAKKQNPAEGSGINQQDEIYSRTDGSSESTESSSTAPAAPSQTASKTTASAKPVAGAGKKQGKKPKYRVKYEAMCELVGAAGGGCITFDEEACPNGDPLITRTISTVAGRVVAMDSYCTREPEPKLPADMASEVENVRAAVEVQRVIEVTPAEFRSFPIAASETVSQPEGFSLRNGNAHMYAIPNPQTFDVDIYDEPVKIRATPQAYSWDYGDGQTKRTQNPGKPMPAHTFDQPTDTSHVYKETGDFQIRLSTSYRGEYSVDGGPWRPIPGTANVPSEPMPMSVWRTKKLLVDQNCAEDPDGPACDSPFLKEKSTSK